MNPILLNALRDFLGEIKLVLRPQWGSENPDHRYLIHKSIKENTLPFSADIVNIKILSNDLEKSNLPYSSSSTASSEFVDNIYLKYPCSVSHSQGLGGYLSFPTNLSMGLDIEPIGRATDAIVNRVFTSDNQAPTPTHLWVAKEACFKAMKGKLISELPVIVLQPFHHPKTWYWEEPTSTGLVFEYLNFCIGVGKKTQR